MNLTASVANDKNGAGVSWAVSGGGALSNSTTGSATYTAPAATSSAQTITVTATSIADATKAGSLTLTVPATPTITNSSLAAATVGSAYSVTMAGSGGISPYKWTLTSGTLPASMTLTAAGVLSGTPLATDVGTLNLTFQMTDSGTATALTASKSLSLTINAAPAMAFTTTTLANGTYNVAYTANVTATGGAGTLTYSLASGPLPTGLSLSAAGVISGTPTVTGTFPITVKAADAFGDSLTQSLSLKVVYPALTVTAATLATGYVGSHYSQQMAATGGSGTGYSWAVAGGSSLPAGLTLSSGGLLSGSPTTQGTTNFTVTVTDSASNTANGSFSVTVDAGVSITTATTLPTGYAGSSYSQQLAATGGTGTGFTWAVSNGSTLPAGLTLSSGGLLSGNPTTTGTPSFGITVTDSASNTASVTFSMTISAGVSVTTTTLPSGYQGTAYAGATLAATGGTGSGYTWTVASGSSLPAGMNLSSGGAISGTPTGSGTSSIVFSVKDSANNTATATLSLTVVATLAVSTTSPLPSGTVAVAYSQTLTASGGSGGNQWTTDSAGTTALTGVGLTLGLNGTISGASPTAGTTSFTVTVTDSASHTATASLSITVYAALTVTTTTLPATNAGVAYSQQLAAGGGTGTGYTWTVTSGASSLTAVNLAVSSGGLITGTPAATGTATFTVKVTDSGSSTATQNLTITVYSALSLPAPNPSSLPSGYTNVAYTGSVTGSGGSGNWAVSVISAISPANGTLGATPNSPTATVNVAGTPTTATTESFTMQLTDTSTSNSVQQTYTVDITTPTPVTLPTTNPSSLPSATVSQSYSGSVSAAGGVSPYTWSVNGTSIPSNGSPVSIANGISVSDTGGSVLNVSGTPTTTTTVNLTNVKVTDSASSTATQSYSITVNSSGQSVSGQISLNNNCGGSPTLPTFTVSINTSPVQTTTTDSSGNYMFSSVPNGTYTITPSITGPSSAFYPATQTGVTVNNANVTSENFGVSLGYTVSGTVSYSGSQTGQIYLTLNNNNCSGNPFGTSISSKGAYTINGVAPGTYTLAAGMDVLGYGSSNANDPSGSNGSVAVSNANVTTASVTMTDPSAVTLTTGPTIQSVNPVDQGALVFFKAITDSNGVEMPTSYTVQWSTTNTFTTIAGSHSFAATGAKGNGAWILSGLTNTAYYFRAEGVAGSSTSAWSTVVGPVTIGAGTTGNTVTGTVTFSGTATGPLYVGFFDQSTNSVYAVRYASPSSPQTYSVKVPTGSNYFLFGILDQNSDGLIDAGDIQNTDGGNSASVSISGNTTMNLTLPSAGSTNTVTTQHWQQTTAGGPYSGYQLSFDVRAGNKLPVAVQLVSGPNVNSPIDIGVCGNCGTPQFQYHLGIDGVRPTVGDTYTFHVTYSDSSTPVTVTALVTAVLDTFPTAMTPSGSVPGNTTPTFTWTDPASASSYTYSFYLSDNSGNTIWQVPGNNSNSNGLDSSITSIVWGTDPTGDSSNTPTVPSLTTSTTYNWQITVQDANGNSAQQQVYFIP
ncbi:MAG TPA: putative Ig domain-containing protein [Terracidiphilus sp.]|nr:putative Ig domain-containing protein [Terracidiphilus sp.]